MSKEIKLIPELRFPEFINEAEWDNKEFGELLSFLSDYTANGSFASLKENVQYYSNEEYAVLVRTTDLEKKPFAPARFTDKHGYEFLSKTSLFGDEIIMANVGSIGKVYKAPFYDKPMTLAPNTYVLKFKKSVDEEFIYQLMLRTEFENKLLSMVGSSTLKAINKKNLRSIEVSIPKKNEQQKIASCLSSLDELLAAHNEKLDDLKNHKKGLMQNLFPQEGETVPKFRFPEFENDGEWVETTVEKLIQEKVLFPPKDGNHGSIHPKSSDYVKTGIPFIMASDLKNGKIDFTKCAYLKKEQADSLQKGFAKSGDVLLTHKGTVGEVALLGELEYPYIMLTPQVTYYRIKNKAKLTSGFLAAFFNSDFFQKNLVKVSGGGTRAYVGITKQREFEINYPKNPEEQTKIASCLTAVDELITAQADKIEQLQQHKKGLMQGLFPKIEN